jgi:S-formylglutathione hydrolase FrmB
MDSSALGDGVPVWPYWGQELHPAFPMLMQAVGAE